jgi:arginine repressor
VVDTAVMLSGAKNGADAIQIIKENQQLSAAVAKGIQADEMELVQLMLDDIKDARRMYIETGHGQANKVSDQIMTWSLPVIVALIAANIAALVFIKETAMAVAVGNLIGASIQAAWAERQQVAGFFLGSSLGSLIKNK